MISGVMITNGGPHPADKWAEATASQVVEITDHLSGERRGMAIKLQAAIVDALLGHHTAVQNGERSMIKEHGHDRLAHSMDAGDHVNVDEVVADVVACASGTPWEDQFSTKDFSAHLKELLLRHFHTSMHIERSWHADHNKDAPQAKAFRSTFNIGG